ncbi:UNVERIFIED_CONTAM: hypothetical protein O8I53_11680 [Campylobacter lari]
MKKIKILKSIVSLSTVIIPLYTIGCNKTTVKQDDTLLDKSEPGNSKDDKGNYKTNVESQKMDDQKETNSSDKTNVESQKMDDQKETNSSDKTKDETINNETKDDNEQLNLLFAESLYKKSFKELLLFLYNNKDGYINIISQHKLDEDVIAIKLIDSLNNINMFGIDNINSLTNEDTRIRVGHGSILKLASLQQQLKNLDNLIKQTNN